MAKAAPKPKPDALVARTQEHLGRRCIPVVNYHLSTGVTLLDLAICPGLAGGRVAEFYGPPGRGKTFTCLLAAAQCLAAGGRVVWMDAEGRLSASLCKLAGIDIYNPKFECYIPESLEQAHAGLHIEIAAALEQEKQARLLKNVVTPTMFVLDSVAFLGSSQESEETMRPMLQSQLWTSFTRKNTLRQMMGSNVYLLLINQIRDDVSFHMHGPKQVKTPGGQALRYCYSLRVLVEDQPFSKGDKAQEIGANPQGMIITYRVTKNSGAPNFREAFTPFYYNSGARDEIALLDYMLEKTVQKHFDPSFKWKGSWVTHRDFEKAKYRHEWIEVLGNNPELLHSLRDEVDAIYTRMSLYDYGE